ncbi:glycoside hydrolase family protein [Mesorhizobium sp. CA7]|uniref:glycoside hydrolase family protein n=1 Tax=Mesorhizobium sp. CA7 TaxID=588501 RepID=UPI001CCFBE1B|nr:hypothetical protein [Mesorhizobium sp. CA7]MBZ9815737.1 hypothetical protein [Mesorhizobium sp. CA7]
MAISRRMFLQISMASPGLALLPNRVFGAAADDFATLLKELQSQPNLAIGGIGHNELAAARVAGLETAPLQGAKSSRQISPEAVDLIIASEITDERTYERRYRGVIWPRGHSGPTCGIGYDIGFVTVGGLRSDWEGYIGKPVVDALASGCGVTGTAARDLLPSFAGTAIDWETALREFKTEMLPRYTAIVERYLDNTDQLSAKSLGALVSLVYNRGASFRLNGDRFTEMRAIRDHMHAKAFDQIPPEIRRMKRLWAADLSGLWVRRDAEAALFEVGLAS